MTKKIKLSEEQKKLANAVTNLERNTVINIELHGMSQRAAYYEAGGRAKTHGTADTTVCRMLKKDKVKAFRESLVEAQVSDTLMKREEAQQILTDIGRSVITDIVDFRSYTVEDKDGKEVEKTHWSIKNSEDISPQAARIIQEVSSGKDGLKIKTHSQLAAIKQLATMNGWDAAQKFEDVTPPENKPMPSDLEIARSLAFLLRKADKEC